MAKQEIVKTAPIIEVMPPTEFPSLAETILGLRESRKELPELKRLAEAIVVIDKATYAQKAEVLNRIRAIGKQGEIKLEPLKAIARGVTNFLQGQLKEHEAECSAVAEPHSTEMSEYNRKERDRTAEEQRQIQRQKDEENARIAEEKRRNDEAEARAKRAAAVKDIKAKLKAGEITKRQAEKMLRDVGATAEAEIEKAAAEEEERKKNPPKVRVESNTVAVAGIQRRIKYEADVVDADALIGAFVFTCILNVPLSFQRSVAEGGKDANKRLADAIRRELKTNYLRRFIMPNAQKLKQEATDVKNSAKLNDEIPGVNFTDKDKV